MGRIDHRRAAAFLFLAAAVSFGCAKTNEESDDALQDSAALAPQPAPAAAPTDAEIAHIAVTANAVDVDMGKFAQDKAQNADVKSFAQTMIADHSSVNEKASALATKLNLTPEDNPTSQQLNADAQTARQQLEAKSGADFDKAYIDHEITYHQQVLDALDKTLIPNAQNAELKDLLNQVRPAVDAHLQRARQIQQSIGK